MQSEKPVEGGFKIWTIGHSTRSIVEFLDLLNEFEIAAVVDIRSLPGSNKFPHFNKDRLEQSLKEKGIDYVHLKRLGGRRKAKPDSGNKVWRNKSFRGYADYMETDEFKTGLSTLKRLARNDRTAYMCSEAVWWRCHRAMISDILKAEGWEVMHIMGKAKTTEHPYTQPAKIIDNELTYAPDKKNKSF